MPAFANCESLNSLVLPEGICEIERATFYECKNLFQVNVPKTVRKIWFDAFDGSGLFTTYKESCENELYIGNWLIHYKCDKLSTLNVKEGTVGISDMDWSQPKKIQSVVLPESLKYIGNDAFNGALINSVKLPKNLLRIGESAFRGTALKEVCIPSSVSDIGIWAFMDCENIEKIIINGTNTNIIWPAITGRKDKKQIVIIAPIKSKANKYCIDYGQKTIWLLSHWW